MSHFDQMVDVGFGGGTLASLVRVFVGCEVRGSENCLNVVDHLLA